MSLVRVRPGEPYFTFGCFEVHCGACCAVVGVRFYNEIERLSPNNDTQRSLQSRTIAAFTEGAQMRLQLFTQVGSSIPTPFLAMMVFWLSAIFVSATLFARANMVVMISLFVGALSFAGAIFLVLELDDPFTGLMGISSSILRGALLPLSS